MEGPLTQTVDKIVEVPRYFAVEVPKPSGVEKIVEKAAEKIVEIPKVIVVGIPEIGEVEKLSVFY